MTTTATPTSNGVNAEPMCVVIDWKFNFELFCTILMHDYRCCRVSKRFSLVAVIFIFVSALIYRHLLDDHVNDNIDDKFLNINRSQQETTHKRYSSIRCDQPGMSCLIENLFIDANGKLFINIESSKRRSVLEYSGFFGHFGIGEPSSYFYIDTWSANNGKLFVYESVRNGYRQLRKKNGCIRRPNSIPFGSSSTLLWAMTISTRCTESP